MTFKYGHSMPRIMLELTVAEFEGKGVVTEPQATLPGWHLSFVVILLPKKH